VHPVQHGNASQAAAVASVAVARSAQPAHAAQAAQAVPAAQAATAPVLRAEPAVQPVSNVVPLHAPVVKPAVAAAAPAYAEQRPAQETPRPVAEVRESRPASGSPVSAYCSAEAWEQWVRDSGLSGGGLNLARHAALVALNDEAVELQLAARHEILASGQSFALIEACFRQQFPAVQIRLVKKDPAYTVPMQVIAARKQARVVAAEASLRSDPVVHTLINDFQAEILPDSIIPIE
jgi:DNA polymerase-3 subunit gamma/tau